MINVIKTIKQLREDKTIKMLKFSMCKDEKCKNIQILKLVFAIFCFILFKLKNTSLKEKSFNFFFPLSAQSSYILALIVF